MALTAVWNVRGHRIKTIYHSIKRYSVLEYAIKGTCTILYNNYFIKYLRSERVFLKVDAKIYQSTIKMCPNLKLQNSLPQISLPQNISRDQASENTMCVLFVHVKILLIGVVLAVLYPTALDTGFRF